jgi:hypothetical protein
MASTDGRSNVNPIAAVGRELSAIVSEIQLLRQSLLVHTSKTVEIVTLSASVQTKINALNAELRTISGNPNYPQY